MMVQQSTDWIAAILLVIIADEIVHLSLRADIESLFTMEDPKLLMNFAREAVEYSERSLSDCELNLFSVLQRIRAQLI